MAKPKKTEEVKEDFIKLISSMTPEEMTKFIQEKGKPRKPVEPMIFFDEQ